MRLANAKVNRLIYLATQKFQSTVFHFVEQRKWMHWITMGRALFSSFLEILFVVHTHILHFSCPVFYSLKLVCNYRSNEEAITAIKLIKTLSSIHQLGRKFCVANFPIGNCTSRQTERIVVKPMKPTQLQDASMLPVIKGRAQIFTKHNDARERSFWSKVFGETYVN